MKKNINKILVAIDFYEQSETSIENIASYARTLKSELIFLYIIEDSGFISQLFRTESQLDSIRNAARQKLEELAQAIMKKEKVRITTMVDSGKVYRKILDIAELVNASTIVMGKTGSSGKDQPGSNTLQVLKRANCPVLIIRNKPLSKSIKNIVLPLDLTKETKDKIHLAIEYARLYDATIRIFSVLNININEKESLIFRKMESARKKIEEAGVKVTTELQKEEDARISKAVVEYASKIKADLIIIMTQQETDFSYNFLGKHAQEIIEKSDVPVLTTIPFENRSSFFEGIFDPFNLKSR